MQLQKEASEDHPLRLPHLDEAMKIGDRILDHGRAGASSRPARPRDIALKPANAYVAEFVRAHDPVNDLRARSLMTPLRGASRACATGVWFRRPLGPGRDLEARRRRGAVGARPSTAKARRRSRSTTASRGSIPPAARGRRGAARNSPCSSLWCWVRFAAAPARLLVVEQDGRAIVCARREEALRRWVLVAAEGVQGRRAANRPHA